MQEVVWEESGLVWGEVWSRSQGRESGLEREVVWGGLAGGHSLGESESTESDTGEWGSGHRMQSGGLASD
jgi:hypothetical protein